VQERKTRKDAGKKRKQGPKAMGDSNSQSDSDEESEVQARPKKCHHSAKSAPTIQSSDEEDST
jgi:hypothetical protein